MKETCHERAVRETQEWALLCYYYGMHQYELNVIKKRMDEWKRQNGSKTKKKSRQRTSKSFRDKPCLIKKDCLGEVCAHHMRTRGAHGDDIESNLLALCAQHHGEVHTLGTITFCVKYGLDYKKWK